MLGFINLSNSGINTELSFNLTPEKTVAIIIRKKDDDEGITCGCAQREPGRWEPAAWTHGCRLPSSAQAMARRFVPLTRLRGPDPGQSGWYRESAFSSLKDEKALFFWRFAPGGGEPRFPAATTPPYGICARRSATLQIPQGRDFYEIAPRRRAGRRLRIGN